MTLPLRVSDLTDEQIRAMGPGIELDLRARLFDCSIIEHNRSWLWKAPDGEVVFRLSMEDTFPPKVNCSIGKYDLDIRHRVSRDDGAAMRLWKAIGEWWKSSGPEAHNKPIYSAYCSIEEDQSGVTCSLKLIGPITGMGGYYDHTVLTVFTSRTLPDLTHAIAILGALAAKWRMENGK